MVVVRRVFFGPMPEKLEGHVGPITAMDKIAIATLCALMVGIGLFPILMVPMVQTGVDHILRLLGVG
jgi:NADH:ubiquinone oxidoreductase subunit 4 (subunit M)